MRRSHLTRLLRRHAARVEVGAAPGAITADDSARPTRAILTVYSAQDYRTLDDPDPADVDPASLDPTERLWIHVTGLADLDWIRRLGAQFGVHELALADIVNVHQRPKVDEYTDHLLIVLRQPISNGTLRADQLSLYLGERFLLTFAEEASAALEPLRRRLAAPHSTLRQRGVDFLAYGVVDCVIDSFFPVLEEYGELLEALETRTIESPEPSTNRDIHAMRSDLLLLRRAVWPLREIVNEMIRSTSTLLGDDTRLYLRDSYDHAIHALDTVETYRELTFGLTDLYMSSLGARMNEIMKVLTIIATVFIPLSFIVGLFGMNFDRSFPANMPELGWPYGYIYALTLMGCTAGGMLLYFRRKGWLGSRRKEPTPTTAAEQHSRTGDED